MKFFFEKKIEANAIAKGMVIWGPARALAGPQITMPLAIAFASIFFSKKNFKDIYGQVFDLKGRSFQKEGSIEEIIYFLTSKGGDLSYQVIPGVSYLSMAIER